MGRNYKSTYGNTGRKGQIGPRPTVLLKWKALPYAIWNILTRGDAGGGFIPPNYDDFDFIAGFKAETDVQNVAVDGDILNLMPKGTITATSVHSTPVLAPDYEGIYQEYPVGAPVWSGGRVEGGDLITNGSFDVNLVGWAAGDWTWNAGTAVAGSASSLFSQNGLATGGNGTCTVKFTGSAPVNGNQVRLTTVSGQWNVVNLTTTPTEYEVEINNDPDSGTLWFYNNHANVIIDNVEVHSSVISTVATTYATLPSDDLIEPHPWLQANAAVTNLLYPSTPAEDSGINSFTIPTTEHILWMEGPGSITSSYGTATEAAPLIFTGTGAAVAFTAVGAPERAQIEAGNIKTTYVPTTTAAASIPKLDYTWHQDNINPADSEIKFDFLADGRDCVVLDFGGTALLTYGDVGNGIELVVNGDFSDGENGWNTFDWGLDNETARRETGTGDNIIQTLSKDLGDTYVIGFDIIETILGGVLKVFSSFSDVTTFPNDTPPGRYRAINTITVINGHLCQFNKSAGSVVVDNISVQEATKGLILDDGNGNIITVPVADGARSIQVVLTGITMRLYVDTVLIGEVSYVPIAQGTIVSNATVYAIRSSNAPAIPPGSEEVTNGNFDNGDVGWTGLNVDGGVANTIATTGYQVISTVAGMDYNVTFVCDASGVSPQLQIQDGNVTGSPVIGEVNPSGDGTMVPYSTTFTALGVDSIIILSNGSNTALWDNISIKMVL